MFGALTRETIAIKLLSIPCILIALTVHEVSHGFIAYKCGDPTAKNMGRLTLNPLKHLDPIGAVCMLIAGFGWAKPVPINTRYFKNPRAGMALSALAGPVSNFIMAFVGVLLYSVANRIFGIFPPPSQAISSVYDMTLNFFSLFALLNIGLGVFNLIPCPPLDGSRIFFVFLPPKFYFGIMKYEQYISIAVMLLLVTGALDAPLLFIRSIVLDGMESIVGLIFLLFDTILRLL